MRAFTLFAVVLTMASILVEAQAPNAGQRGGGAAAPAAPAASAQAAPAGNADNGKKIFSLYGCYECHGWVAQGGGAGARLAPRPIPFAGFTKYVRRPTNQMPPYSEKVVTDQELADIYAFLQTIPAPPSVSSIPILNNP